MRILHVGKFYPVTGGIEKMMVDIVSGMSDCKGIYCDMLCASVNHHSFVVSIGAGSRIMCTPTWFKVFAVMLSPMMDVVLRKIKKDYDIIHVHRPDLMAALAPWISGYKGKVISRWRSDTLEQRLTLRLYAPLQQWPIGRADVIVGTSPVYLCESPFLQSERLKRACIPIGISPLLPDTGKVTEIRREYAGRKLIFSSGRLVEYKGFEYLIEAAALLPDEYLILIGGNGPLKQKLEELIEARQLRSKVKPLSRVSDENLSGYFGACDLYVMSFVWKTEAFGIVQIEAMLCGKPVVATKIKGSGVPWVNKDGVSGINAEPESAMEIADAIVRILSDKERYKMFSHVAKERYETPSREERMIKKCVDLYKNVVKFWE